MLLSLPGDRAPRVADEAWVAPGATVVGDVTLEPGASVWYGAVVRADNAPIVIGRDSNLQDNVSAHVDPAFPLTVGARVSVGHNAVLHGCTIEDDVLIGMSATVMNGARIGAGSLVAAGAVVTQGADIPPRSLVAGVPAKVRRELTGDELRSSTTRERPGLEKAMAACRPGDTLVVTKLDRLARSLPDARDIASELLAGGVRLSLGGTVHDPTDPIGRLLFNVLAMVAEFEADLLRARTREGMQIARERGRLRGRKPKLSPAQEKHLVTLHAAGEHTIAELCELFSVGRATVYRALDRSAGQARAA